MICKNCGTECPDNVGYCVNCGTPLQQENQYQQSESYTAPNEPYTMPNYGNYNAYNSYNPYNQYNQPVQESKPISMGTYLGWFLLGSFLGPISIIISIVFACMTSNRNRANFFRAMLVIWAISVGIGIIVSVAVAFFGFSMMATVEPEMFGFEYYDSFLKIASLLKF